MRRRGLAMNLELSCTMQSQSSVPEPLLVTAAVIEHAGCVLIARRASSDHAGAGWEFPGGKVEPGETPQQCLARELHEELGVHCVIGADVADVMHAYPTRTIRLLAFRARITAGAVHPAEHVEIAWVPIAALSTYPLLPADVPIAQALQRQR